MQKKFHEKLMFIVSFEVMTAASMKMAVFWVFAPCGLLEVYQP
jgi:hypothetical protein